MFNRFPTKAVPAVLALGFAISLLHGASTAAAEKKQPNLIVIMADDLGAKELSCYGHEQHETPRLDQLAASGVQFQTAYTACICHPTRFEIMTGQYGSTNGVFHFAGRPGGPDPGSPEEQIVNHLTFGKVLKQAGYATAHSGKWQLTGKVPTLVYENGFDEYCMWAYAHNLPEGVKHTGGFEGGTKTSRYWHPSILKKGKKLPTTIDDFGPDIYTDFVIDFARRHKDGPFFIYYPMALTHSPYYSMPPSNPNEKEKFRHSKDKFKENVEYMDTLVGRIVDALDEIGIREDTIVMFTGDNGTGGQGKGQPTELGARVPMIVNCPGRVKPIGSSDALVDTSDVMPTLVELAGTKLPDGHAIDGKSFAPILCGEKTNVRDWIFSYVADGRVLRTNRFLLERNTPNRYGQLYDCGTSRNGSGYKDVTDSTDPDVLAIKEKFDEILATKSTPDMGKPVQKPRKRGKKKTK
jgi:arylsulfatase A